MWALLSLTNGRLAVRVTEWHREERNTKNSGSEGIAKLPMARKGLAVQVSMAYKDFFFTTTIIMICCC